MHRLRRKKRKKTKGTHFSTGPTTSSRHSKNLKLQTVPPPFCGNVNSTCLITPNNRWKQLSSINLSYFDVSSSPNYVTLSLYSSIGRGLPIGHSIHFNYHQKYHRSEETTHAPQSRHNGSNDIFCNRMQIRPVLVLYIQILDSQYKTNPTKPPVCHNSDTI